MTIKNFKELDKLNKNSKYLCKIYAKPGDLLKRYIRGNKGLLIFDSPDERSLYQINHHKYIQYLNDEMIQEKYWVLLSNVEEIAGFGNTLKMKDYYSWIFTEEDDFIFSSLNLKLELKTNYIF
jgi:hypothetical protein